MLATIKRLREVVDGGYSHRKRLERRQEIADQQLYDHAIAVVDEIITQAQQRGRVDVWSEPESEHVTAWWDPTQEDTTIQRTTVSAGRVDRAIYIEPGLLRGLMFPDDGPWLCTTSTAPGKVYFMPGAGFTVAAGLLEHIAANAGVYGY